MLRVQIYQEFVYIARNAFSSTSVSYHTGVVVGRTKGASAYRAYVTSVNIIHVRVKTNITTIKIYLDFSGVLFAYVHTFMSGTGTGISYYWMRAVDGLDFILMYVVARARGKTILFILLLLSHRFRHPTIGKHCAYW